MRSLSVQLALVGFPGEVESKIFNMVATDRIDWVGSIQIIIESDQDVKISVFMLRAINNNYSLLYAYW